MRQKTDSITHLVKIVAKEVFDEHTDNLKEEVFEAVLSKLKEREITHLHPVDDRSYKAWDQYEDEVLVNELNSAIQSIALSHGRSFNAILARIQQKELLKWRK